MPTLRECTPAKQVPVQIGNYAPAIILLKEERTMVRISHPNFDPSVDQTPCSSFPTTASISDSGKPGYPLPSALTCWALDARLELICSRHLVRHLNLACPTIHPLDLSPLHPSLRFNRRWVSQDANRSRGLGTILGI